MKRKPAMKVRKPAREYDVMRDVVVRAGIRDTMIADMARALEALANWSTTAAEHEFPDDVAGAQEYAEMALRRYREAHAKL